MVNVEMYDIISKMVTDVTLPDSFEDRAIRVTQTKPIRLMESAILRNRSSRPSIAEPPNDRISANLDTAPSHSLQT
ncbi:MAG: hypothetical protein AAFX02_09320, partial [Pseudomonadota bacterium]